MKGVCTPWYEFVTTAAKYNANNIATDWPTIFSAKCDAIIWWGFDYTQSKRCLPCFIYLFIFLILNNWARVRWCNASYPVSYQVSGSSCSTFKHSVKYVEWTLTLLGGQLWRGAPKWRRWRWKESGKDGQLKWLMIIMIGFYRILWSPAH